MRLLAAVTRMGPPDASSGPPVARLAGDGTDTPRTPLCRTFQASQQGYGRAAAAGRIGTHYNPHVYNHHAQAQSQSSSPIIATNVFAMASSSDSFDSDTEVLPMAATPADPEGRAEAGRGGHRGEEEGSAAVGEDGKWFQTLDERYLLPLFSNATASRTFHARRARRNASLHIQSPGGNGTPHESEEEPDSPAVDLTAHGSTGTPPREFPRTQSPEEQSRSERGLATPTLRNGVGREDGQSTAS